MLPTSYPKDTPPQGGSELVWVTCTLGSISMSNLELLVALAYTPLGVAIALPFVCLALSGVHHIGTTLLPKVAVIWVRRVPVNNKRTKRPTNRMSAVRWRV